MTKKKKQKRISYESYHRLNKLFITNLFTSLRGDLTFTE